MGGANFEHYKGMRPGATVRTLFDEAWNDAEAEHGHQEGYSGAINAKPGYTLRRREPMTRAEAERFIYGDPANEQDGGDLDKNENRAPAFVVPICDEADRTTVIGYLFYGYAAS